MLPTLLSASSGSELVGVPDVDRPYEYLHLKRKRSAISFGIFMVRVADRSSSVGPFHLVAGHAMSTAASSEVYVAQSTRFPACMSHDHSKCVTTVL